MAKEKVNKPGEQTLCCKMAGKGFCPYEKKDGGCAMTDNCANHIYK